MAEAVFDPGGFYDLEVASGQLTARNEGPVVVLHRDVASALPGAAVSGERPEAVSRIGARLGETVSRSLDTPAARATPEAVAGRVADVLGVFGWGRVIFEVWGPAIALRWPDTPVMPAAASALLAGMLGAIAEREVACVPLADERYLVVSPRIAGTVRAWAAQEDADVASIVARLSAETEASA